MGENKEKDGALGNVRVLDMTDQKGVYCTKLLADLGADVIRIEPPGGDAMRRIGPFYHYETDPEKSLYWFHFNTSKRGITLNLEVEEGRKIFRKLIEKTDILIETYPPSYLEERGIGYSELSKLNPALVMTSITNFGQTGPWKDYKSSDLVALALGGLLYVCGWPDLPPLRMGGSQAYHQVSVEASVATLIAYYHSIMTGEGQHIDVALHQAIPICLQSRPQVYLRAGVIAQREGDEHREGASGVFPCKDGFVDIRIFVHRWDALVDWMKEEGMAGDLTEEKWYDPFYRLKEENQKHIDTVLRPFLMKHSKREIYEVWQSRGVVVGMVDTAAEVVENRQLKARNFFTDVEHPELKNTLKYLGPPYRLSETPSRISRRAPQIGEHNYEIYSKELGLPSAEISRLKEAQVI